MNIEPIEYDGGVIWVDKEAIIYPDDYFYYPEESVVSKFLLALHAGQFKPSQNGCFKVVAQSPKLSIPNVPYVEIIENRLSADNIIDNHLNLVGQTNFDVYSNRDSVKEAMIMYAAQEVKAASAKKWSDEDMKLMFGLGAANHAIGIPSFEDAIQSLQPKIKSIEIEMEDVHGVDRWNTYPIQYKKDGKTFLKVKKINYE